MDPSTEARKIKEKNGGETALRFGPDIPSRTRVCAYVRVSTKDKEQLSSFENQITYFKREFGASGEKGKWELVKLYADCGRSGTSLHRPDFDRMIQDAGIDRSVVEGDLFRIRARPLFERILVKNTSRFARNVSSDMLIKTLTKNGVYIDFVDTNLSTERPADIMTLQVLQVLDEHESRDKSRKVLFGIEEDIRKENIHSLGSLYGYRYYPKPVNRLEAIPEEAEVVREIFRLYVEEGLGAHRIAKQFSERKILTRKGKEWNPNTILGILANEVYTGKAVRRKYEKGFIFEYHTVRKSENPIVFSTEKIDAIISEELYRKAALLRKERRTGDGSRGKSPLRAPLTNLIVCGECGEPYIAIGTRKTKKNGTVRIYSCRKKAKKECSSRDVTDAKIFRFAEENTCRDSVLEHLAACKRRLGAKRKEALALLDTESEKQLEEVTKALSENEAKRTRLLQLYLDAAYAKEELDRLAEPLLAKEIALKEEKKKLSFGKEEIRDRIRELDRMIDMMEAKELTLRMQENGPVPGKSPASGKSEKDGNSVETVLGGIEKIIVYGNGSIELVSKEIRIIDEFMKRAVAFKDENS